MPQDWESKFEALRASRLLTHNADYLEFLVSKVWRIDRSPVRVAEFGCGYGRFAAMLMPMLAADSSYVGFDSAATLVAKGVETFAGSPHRVAFLRGDAHAAPLRDGLFDVTIAHLVLMHVPDAERVLREMIRVTRSGGLVIACDASRNAINAMLHIEESNEQETFPLEFAQTMYRTIRHESGVDHNIGMKTPVMMHRLGLLEVQARVSDLVATLFPPCDTEEKRRMFEAMCHEGLGYQPTEAAELERWRTTLIARGIAPAMADREMARELERDFMHQGPSYHTVMPSLLTFSFGTVV